MTMRLYLRPLLFIVLLASFSAGPSAFAVVVVEGLDTAYGGTDGGDTIEIRGSGFLGNGTPQVKLGGDDASNVRVLLDSRIHCDAPPHAPGWVDVTLTFLDGSVFTLPHAYQYRIRATVASVTPDTGDEDGGSTITIKGTGITGVQGWKVLVHGALATDVVAHGGMEPYITCVTPRLVLEPYEVALLRSPFPVQIADPEGVYSKINGTFYYKLHVGPCVPSQGSVYGGSRVHVEGDWAVPASQGKVGINRVFFGDVEAKDAAYYAPSWEDPPVVCTPPPHAAGFVDVTVRNARGTATIPHAYEYVHQPQVLSVRPNVADVHGGADMAIKCADLPEGKLDIWLAPDSFPVSGITLVRDGAMSTIWCKVPATVGYRETFVSVNLNGHSVTSCWGNFFSTVDAPDPKVSAISPTAGLADASGPVTIEGTEFSSEGMRVFFGEAEGMVLSSKSGVTLTCQPPQHAEGVVDVWVMNPNGQMGVLRDSFTFTSDPARPYIASVAPDTGPTAKPTPIIVTGERFDIDQPVRVLVGGVEAADVVVSDGTSIRCTAPAHAAAGAVDVTVDANGKTYTLTNGFTYDNSVKAAFTSDKRAGNPPLDVEFTDTSEGLVTSWLWDFGDGTESIEQNPYHIYETAGGYTVSLTASNSDASNTYTATWYINVGHAVPAGGTLTMTVLALLIAVLGLNLFRKSMDLGRHNFTRTVRG